MLDAALIDRLYAQADAAKWSVARDAFARALTASADRMFAARTATAGELSTYLSGLHLTDLALACGCDAGDDDAWRHFMLEYRPLLYRAADAIDATGGARELADALYAELYGLKEGGDGARRSLFRYFHGRSSLATWLRAVLAQRLVDRVRERRRLEPLPDDDPDDARVTAGTVSQPAPEPARCVQLLTDGLAAALSTLQPNERLRFGCYYARQMTLAQIGRLLGEHEATVSRQLSRTRATIRAALERHLAEAGRFSADEVDDCFRAAAEDSGTLDLQVLLGGTPTDPGREEGAPDSGSAGVRKKSGPLRSRREES